MKSEAEFLKLIDAHFPRDHKSLDLGRGDDCAVFAADKQYCVSSDLFLEDVHFRRSYFSPADIAYKGLAVNISDIAAMGAKPVAFTLDLMAPAGLDDGFWEEFFTSLSTLARQNEMVLAGGDLSRCDKLGMSISVFGIPRAIGFLRRKNCNVGDTLFTVGDLGMARAGLTALETEGLAARDRVPGAVMAHLRPRPKVMIGSLLCAAEVKSIMDLSDGLARDLPRFLPDGLGADLTIDPEILQQDVKTIAGEAGIDPVQFAMLGGEDYALLGAVSPENVDKAACVPGYTPIGTVTDKPGIILNGSEYLSEGFDHFSD